MSLRVFVVAASAMISLTGCSSVRMLEIIPLASAPPAHEETAPGWGKTTVSYKEQPPAMIGPPVADGPYTLDTGDRLRIFVYGQPNLSRLYTVDHSGYITFPLVGTIRARGQTTTALERIIAQRLSTNYVKDPQVTVDIQQNRPFFILGEVRSAGQYPFVSGMTVESAVAIAGGYQDRAREDQFRITRRRDGVVEVLEVPPDFPVQPGDSIYVRERFF
jgi:polysaccharide export outer membrane protein